MSAPKITDVTTQIVGLLEPFSPDERKRIVQASLTLLGDTHIPESMQKDNTPADEGNSLFPRKVVTWMKQNDLTEDALHQVFHFADTEVSIIASGLPGKSNKDRTIAGYVLVGITNFLMSENPSFTDKAARDYCTEAGCYDSTNHNKYLKDKGNVIAGTKDKGWSLTAPGLKRGAEIIKELST